MHIKTIRMKQTQFLCESPDFFGISDRTELSLTALCLCSIIVDKIDSSRDGFVSEDELKLWIRRSQQRHVDDSVERQWNDFDLNNDGRVSWDEYSNITYGSFLGKSSDSSLVWSGTSEGKPCQDGLIDWLIDWLVALRRPSDGLRLQLHPDDAKGRETFQSCRRKRRFDGRQTRVLSFSSSRTSWVHEGHCSAGEGDNTQVMSSGSYSIYVWYVNVCSQETMEDIDKNGDGFIDLKEYIGKKYWDGRGSGGRAIACQSLERWFDFWLLSSYVEVSLSKTLSPKLPPVCQISLPSVCECVNKKQCKSTLRTNKVKNLYIYHLL